ncbi:peptidoglycan DD-metalloendopeptidase family protein [bacterium]|nr:peptidoglycan DD-metalloendopeptidase family protein [bacterium]
MSYARGRLILVLLVILLLHSIFGGIGYYRIYRLGKWTSVLEEENRDLNVRNQKIEEIAEQFELIRLRDEQIRRAFGTQLGLEASPDLDLIIMNDQVNAYSSTLRAMNEETASVETSRQPVQNGLYFLTEGSGEYFDPEYLPTRLPVNGYVTTRFQEGGWFVGRSHLGIDIAAQKGTSIRAAGSGIILFADWTPDFGNLVVIAHGNGLFSYYAHAMRLLVAQGMRVKRGDVIALVGSSGISSAPHLHFEIWKNGKALDPEEFIFALQGPSE